MTESASTTPLSRLLAEIPHALQGLTVQTTYRQLRDDSRDVEPGDVYLATVGERSDGHDFVAMAAKRGAVAHIVQSSAMPSRAQAWSTLPLIVVDDSLACRAKLAANHFGWPGRALDLVGITGTNGKTTVTHLLAELWRAQEHPSARLGTTDNWIVDRHYPARFTTPFPLELQSWLARAKDAGAKSMALEVSSHAMAQGRVDELAFRAVALTSFSQDHLDFHPTMQAYLDAKCELAGRVQSNGLAVAPINAGAPAMPAASAFFEKARANQVRCLGVSLSSDPSAELHCTTWSQDTHGLQAQVQSPWGPFELRSPLVGAFNLENLLCASAIALDLGMSTAALAQALPGCKGAPGRLERVLVEDPLTHPAVYVDYAHTPDAVARASATLRDQHAGQLITVLGCGGDRDKDKRPLMAKAALENSDFVVFSSDNPRTEDPKSIIDDMVKDLAPGQWSRVCDRREAIRQAISMSKPSDRVLIAGKGHETYQIIGNTRFPFDDREEAKLALLESRSAR